MICEFEGILILPNGAARYTEQPRLSEVARACLTVAALLVSKWIVSRRVRQCQVGISMFDF